MSVSSQAFGDRLRRLTELAGIFKDLQERFNLSEIPQAWAAFGTAAALTRSSDLSDPLQLGRVTDAWLEFSREATDITKTEADDAWIETIAKLRANFDWLIGIVAGLLKARSEGLVTALSVTACEEATALAIDPATLMAIVKVILDLIEMFRRK